MFDSIFLCLFQFCHINLANIYLILQSTLYKIRFFRKFNLSNFIHRKNIGKSTQRHKYKRIANIYCKDICYSMLELPKLKISVSLDILLHSTQSGTLHQHAMQTIGQKTGRGRLTTVSNFHRARIPFKIGNINIITSITSPIFLQLI